MFLCCFCWASCRWILTALNETPRSFSISTCPKAQFSFHGKDVQVTLNIKLKRPKTKTRDVILWWPLTLVLKLEKQLSLFVYNPVTSGRPCLKASCLDHVDHDTQEPDSVKDFQLNGRPGEPLEPPLSQLVISSSDMTFESRLYLLVDAPQYQSFKAASQYSIVVIN